MTPDNKRIEQILQSIDGLPRADAPTYLATRLRARLLNPEATRLSGWEHWAAWLSRPGVLASVLVLVTALNAGLLWWKLPAEPTAYTTTTPSLPEEESDAYAISDSNSPLEP